MLRNVLLSLSDDVKERVKKGTLGCYKMIKQTKLFFVQCYYVLIYKLTSND